MALAVTEIRVNGLVRRAADLALVTTSDAIVRHVNGWPVDGDGRVVVRVVA